MFIPSIHALALSGSGIDLAHLPDLMVSTFEGGLGFEHNCHLKNSDVRTDCAPLIVNSYMLFLCFVLVIVFVFPFGVVAIVRLKCDGHKVFVRFCGLQCSLNCFIK